MRQRLAIFSSRHIALLSVLVIVWAFPSVCLGQAAFTAQVRGTVKDASGAMIPGATVLITAMQAAGYLANNLGEVYL